MIDYGQNKSRSGHPKKTDMEEKREEADRNQQIIDSYDYLGSAASAQDCTGLIPAKPATEAERESYEDLYEYQYLPPKFPPEKKVF